MTREKALSQVFPFLSYHFNDCKPAFAIEECKKWINKIYDGFDQQLKEQGVIITNSVDRTCLNCDAYDKDFFTKGKSYCSNLDTTNVFDDFYCSSWEVKAD